MVSVLRFHHHWSSGQWEEWSACRVLRFSGVKIGHECFVWTKNHRQASFDLTFAPRCSRMVHVSASAPTIWSTSSPFMPYDSGRRPVAFPRMTQRRPRTVYEACVTSILEWAIIPRAVLQSVWFVLLLTHIALQSSCYIPQIGTCGITTSSANDNNLNWSP